MEITQTPMLGDRFEMALVLAHRLHRAQVRKGHRVPYIAHLLGVAALVLEDGGDEDEAIAALLHDAVEDQGGEVTRALIREQFGDRVVGIIDGCTEEVLLPRLPWRLRKERHLVQLGEAGPEVCRVTLADKLHNVRSLLVDYQRLGEEMWGRFGGGREGTLWYYWEVVSVMEGQSSGGLMVGLVRSVERLQELCDRGLGLKDY